eukprot:TRINITY_DN13010_c0_g1_i1.p1 TRINITY_DN13010_c0_g1~~TRINITY_DN13010_c0_g1_i1.p1  ORF type:complete len:308 (-),score=45.23 TRINITY_DN13010_c0_g1_i1:234-1157(-)
MMADSTSRWWSESTVAVVTGANKGIGFSMVKALARNGIITVLTSRDVRRGEDATKKLRDDYGLPVVYHQLDVSNTESAQNLADWLKQQYGGVDILINNAAIVDSPEMLGVLSVAQTVVNTNFYGTKNVTNAILPLFRPSQAGARIINISSATGLLAGLAKESARQVLANLEELTEERLDDLVHQFYADVERNQSSSWYPATPPAYAFSKVAQNAYTRLLARRLSFRPPGQKVYVNAFRPGPTMTDMLEPYINHLKKQGFEPFHLIEQQWGRIQSPDEVAAHPVWLALLPQEEIPFGILSQGRTVINF